jgi:DNA-directed RNA polymerase specialized sigma24 family protein
VARAVSRGDFESAATAVIEGYGPQVLGYLRAVVKDPEEAEDSFALFAENVWRGLPTWEGRATFLALLGGFIFDTGRRGQAAPSAPIELRS